MYKYLFINYLLYNKNKNLPIIQVLKINSFYWKWYLQVRRKIYRVYNKMKLNKNQLKTCLNARESGIDRFLFLIFVLFFYRLK